MSRFLVLILLISSFKVLEASEEGILPPEDLIFSDITQYYNSNQNLISFSGYLYNVNLIGFKKPFQEGDEALFILKVAKVKAISYFPDQVNGQHNSIPQISIEYTLEDCLAPTCERIINNDDLLFYIETGGVCYKKTDLGDKLTSQIKYWQSLEPAYSVNLRPKLQIPSFRPISTRSFLNPTTN